MKRFYGSIFIEKEKLEEAGVENPIKLEYYKIINEDEFVKGTNSKYGIKIVKTQYIENDTKTGHLWFIKKCIFIIVSKKACKKWEISLK